jgi:hypothetical protein
MSVASSKVVTTGLPSASVLNPGCDGHIGRTMEWVRQMRCPCQWCEFRFLRSLQQCRRSDGIVFMAFSIGEKTIILEAGEASENPDAQTSMALPTAVPCTGIISCVDALQK